MQDLSSPFTGSPRGVAGLRGVTKQFGGTVALSDASFDLMPGEVLALLGENGAGKSTCVKLLAGVHQPTRGEVHIGGEPVTLRSPLDAQRMGIAVMHQHPGLFADLSVAENLFMGRQLKSPLGALDHRRMHAEAERLLETVGLSCAPRTPLGRLRSSEQQLVEVARSLSVQARVLIMDEPTAALTTREVDRLFDVVAQLRTRGVAMMFVGHRMEEIYSVSDRVAVLRDGRIVEVAPVADMPHDRAVRLMIGRPLSDRYPALAPPAGPVVLEVEQLGRDGAFEDVSFDLKAGEILGIGGLVGSGRTEIARVLFGIDRPTSGHIVLAGERRVFASAAEAMEAGVAYVSEDRLGQSLVMDFGILTNATLAVLDQVKRAGLVNREAELRAVTPHLDRLRLRYRSYDQPISDLSGGNQQKVVLSKWLATGPKVLILDEPTQGVDVQTKAEVHAMMADLARGGMAIVMISSELPELLGMSHRVLVMREGRVSGAFDRSEATQESVIYAATDAGRATAAASAPRIDATVPEATATATAERGTAARRLSAALPRRELGLLVVIVAVVLGVSLLNPRMLSASNLSALAMDTGLLLIVALAQMLVLLTRNIDLSVASVIGLSAYVAAALMRSHPELGTGVAIGAAMGVGLACGLVNGAIVTYGGVPAIVVTLGTLAMYRGLDSMLASGSQVSADQVPASWLEVSSRSMMGLPATAWFALAAALAVGLGLRYATVGRDVYAIGSNPDGARLIGIPIGRRVLAVFCIAGMLAGFTGAMWASRYATIDSRTAFGFELTVIAAVVVGGVAIRGGSGTVLGVVLGVVALLLIRNGLVLLRIDPLWLQAVYGLAILAAITIDAVVTRRANQPRRVTRSLA